MGGTPCFPITCQRSSRGTRSKAFTRSIKSSHVPRPCSCRFLIICRNVKIPSKRPRPAMTSHAHDQPCMPTTPSTLGFMIKPPSFIGFKRVRTKENVGNNLVCHLQRHDASVVCRVAEFSLFWRDLQHPVSRSVNQKLVTNPRT